ncbi:MAG: preprotein translocase subunit YajC [Propionibacteriaceae bacterium]|jgi:preprotein translocase subunit YajC|nr:preprotein translocase subunit YajC [Propionibacteriaceae bacterium]
MDPMTLIFLLIIIGVIFMMSRSMKKQQQRIKDAQDELNNSMEPGKRVMLTSGIYGTIRHLGENQIILEISPGVDLTVSRIAIKQVVGPDDEEFEYADEGAEIDDDLAGIEIPDSPAALTGSLDGGIGAVPSSESAPAGYTTPDTPTASASEHSIGDSALESSVEATTDPTSTSDPTQK